MATINEQIVTGRKFRKLIDEATKLWQRISFWTKASDVEFDDGSTAETKMGAINGITDSLVSTSSNIAASAKALSQLNNKLNGCSLEQDGEDFYIVGADAVRKKLGSTTTTAYRIYAGTISFSSLNITISATKYPDYKKLTLDNFYFTTAGTYIAGNNALARPKLSSYDSNTGTLTIYNSWGGAIAYIELWVVPDITQKVILT